MLNEFIEWAKYLAINQSQEAIDMRVTVDNASVNPSARLDVDTPLTVARITCWESGDYDAEIIDLDSEKQTYVRSGKIETETPFSEQFRSFFDVLGIVIN